MSHQSAIKPDRYVSFRGIRCTEQASLVLEHVFAIIDDPTKTNPFWEKFRSQIIAAADAHVRVKDELCLLCSHTYFIEELFDEHDDEVGLGHLKKIEEECC